MTVTPRPLGDREREVLDALLGTGLSLEPFRQQVDALRIVGGCECGCPTVEFGTHRQSGGMRVLAEAAVVDSHDSILLFANDQNELASLEYVGVGATNPPVFPEPAELVVLPRR